MAAGTRGTVRRRDLQADPGPWPPLTPTSQCASPGRTGRPDHVEHIYAKIDASNRATAAMFAVRRGLLPEETITITAAL
ncbi:MAG TPA: hypothetical protein VFQ68_32440 [Streptosporangiaceae bacterium]|nr:hypothetical protein [Streptosporangiaceae bacterium]